MRHRKRKLQLNRFTSWYKASLKSLCRSVLIYQSIKTTVSKAKAVKPLVEELISLAKKNTLAAKRRAYQILCDHKLVSMLFNEIGPRFEKRNSGFTRTIPIGVRRGDNVELALFELTEIKVKEKKIKKAKQSRPEGEEGAHQVSAVEQKEEKKTEIKEKPPVVKKPAKKFLGGIKNIFKKERDSL